MGRVMLEYTQELLEKVSFDPVLFQKELHKALKRLQPHEIVELKIFLNKLKQNKPQIEACLKSFALSSSMA